jgi:hypothetical protein
MPHGVPTEEETVAEFRARYLYSGNASAVARQLDLDERTGRRIAERIEEDPSFAEDVRKLHAHALKRHVTMRIRVCERAAERFEEELAVPEVVGDGNVTIIDKRPEYARVVLDGEKNAHALAKFEAELEKPGDKLPRRLEIILTDREPEPDPPDGAE